MAERSLDELAELVGIGFACVNAAATSVLARTCLTASYCAVSGAGGTVEQDDYDDYGARAGTSGCARRWRQSTAAGYAELAVMGVRGVSRGKFGDEPMKWNSLLASGMMRR
jgi:hypothetical protein